MNFEGRGVFYPFREIHIAEGSSSVQKGAKNVQSRLNVRMIDSIIVISTSNEESSKSTKVTVENYPRARAKKIDQV